MTNNWRKKTLINLATPAVQIYKKKKVDNLIDAGLPPCMKAALVYLVTENADPITEKVINLVENRRTMIAAGGDKKVPIWYSPKPKTKEEPSTRRNTRPEPGELMEFTMERVAKTGKSLKWGTALYLIAREFQSTTVVELGACAGISAMYLASPSTVKTIVTVEGSDSLANIAKESLQAFENAKVVNSLFDEAIDSDIPLLNDKIDLAYIDGHHEKVATIHYFDRLVPYLNPGGGVVVFDDISWSQDMREAWDILSEKKDFSHAMDLGEIGVCVLKNHSQNCDDKPKYWHLQSVVGKHAIGKPHGWK